MRFCWVIIGKIGSDYFVRLRRAVRAAHECAFACDLSDVLTDTIRTDIPTIPAVQLPTAQPTNQPLNDLQQDYLGLIAANCGIELPHLETEDDARGFMARIVK